MPRFSRSGLTGPDQVGSWATRPAEIMSSVVEVIGSSAKGDRDGPDRTAWQAKRPAPELALRRACSGRAGSGGLHAGQAGERHCQVGLVIVEVLQLAGEIIHVG